MNDRFYEVTVLNPKIKVVIESMGIPVPHKKVHFRNMFTLSDFLSFKCVLMS